MHATRAHYLYFVPSPTSMGPKYHVLLYGGTLFLVLYIHIYLTAILCIPRRCGIDHHRLILHFHRDIQRLFLLIVSDTKRSPKILFIRWPVPNLR